MKKIFLAGAQGMLGTDFIRHFHDTFDIIGVDRDDGNITNLQWIERLIKNNKPDVILNFAAYTNVDDAEDVGRKINFDVNALGVYNLAKIAAKYAIDFITISTDYVFDGTKKEGYSENDDPNPINSYGMAKYLGERLAKQEDPNCIIIRTSWLYGGGKKFKNFVNTMLTLSETKKELKIVNDQFGSPTHTVDLCETIVKVMDDIVKYRGKILHFCNLTNGNGISWFELTQEVFRVAGEEMNLVPCSSEEFPVKARRPKWSKLVNGSDIMLRGWKEGLRAYLDLL